MAAVFLTSMFSFFIWCHFCVHPCFDLSWSQVARDQSGLANVLMRKVT